MIPGLFMIVLVSDNIKQRKIIELILACQNLYNPVEFFKGHLIWGFMFCVLNTFKYCLTNTHNCAWVPHLWTKCELGWIRENSQIRFFNFTKIIFVKISSIGFAIVLPYSRLSSPFQKYQIDRNSMFLKSPLRNKWL